MPVLHSRFRRPLVVLLSFALIVASLASAGSFVFAQSSDLDTASLAQGHAQVVAQGMSAPPATKAFWRVVERSVPIRAKAQASDNLMGGTGFLVASDKAILVIDQKSKARTRLAPGESLFVAAGSIQTWASLDDKAAAEAYTLELVADGTSQDVPSGKIVYADKKSWAIPEGDYVLGLVRDILAKNEKGKIGKGTHSTLLLAMSGSVTVQSDAKGAKAVTVKGGSAAVFTGNLVITAGKSGGSYVAALIGPATGISNVTPVTSTPTPKTTATATAKATKTPTPKKTATPKASATKKPKKTATPAPKAAVTIGLAVCPNGIRPETGVPGLMYCSAGYGYYDFSLIGPDGSVMPASAEAVNYVTWSNLNPGVYQLLINLIPPGFDSFTLDGYLCCSTPGGYLITVDKGAQVTGTIYVYQPYVPPPTPTPASNTTNPTGAGGGPDSGNGSGQQPAG